LSLDCDAAYIGGKCTCYSNWSTLASPTYLSCMQLLAAGVVFPCWHGATTTVNRVDGHVSALAAETRDLILRTIPGTLLIRFVWSDGKMEPGLGEIIFNVSVGVAVIVPWGGSF